MADPDVMTDFTDSVVDFSVIDVAGRDEAINNETKTLEKLRGADKNFSSLSIDGNGNTTRDGKPVTSDYKGTELPIAETLKNEIMEQKYNDVDADPDNAEKSAEKLLKATMGDNVPETVTDATTKKITEKIRADRNNDPNYPSTLSKVELKVIVDASGKIDVKSPEAQKIIKDNVPKSDQYITKEEFKEVIKTLKESYDTKLANNAEAAEQAVEKEGLFEKYGGKLLMFSLGAFLLGEMGTALGKNGSGCMATYSNQTASGQTAGQSCKITQFTCDSDYASQGNPCSKPIPKCQGAKGEKDYDDCMKVMNNPCANADPIKNTTSNEGVFGEKGIECSGLCANKYLVTQDGSNSYNYNCVYCDTMCGVQGIFQLLAKIANAALGDAGDLSGFLSSFLKYGLFGLLIIFVVWIIYKVLSSLGNKKEMVIRSEP